MKVICSNCGISNSNEANLCSACGNSLENTISSIKSNTIGSQRGIQSGSARKVKIIIIIVVFLQLIAVLAFSVFLKR